MPAIILVPGDTMVNKANKNFFIQALVLVGGDCEYKNKYIKDIVC